MQRKAKQSNVKQCNAKQWKAHQSKARQCKAMQSEACKARQCKAMQSIAMQSNAKHTTTLTRDTFSILSSQQMPSKAAQWKNHFKAKQRKTKQSNTNANQSHHQNKALELSKGKTSNWSRAGSNEQYLCCQMFECIGLKLMQRPSGSKGNRPHTAWTLGAFFCGPILE